MVHKEFLGFFFLLEFDAKFITKTVLEACSNIDIDINKCVGQGFDGRALSGVQKQINNVYPMANFFHWCKPLIKFGYKLFKHFDRS